VFSQLRSSGLAVRGIEIQAAAERLSKQMGLEQFKASSGGCLDFVDSTTFQARKFVGKF
jgi:hypothetical protein